MPEVVNSQTGWAMTGYTRDQLFGMKDWQSDPILVRTLSLVQEQITRLRHAEADLTSEILSRLREREGSVMPGGDYEAVLDIQHTWACDLETLADAQAYLSPEEWDRLAPQPPQPERRPNKTVANQLAKRGGPLARIIESAYSEIPSEPKLKIRRVKS